MIETNSPGGFQGQVGTAPHSSPNANYNAMLAMMSLYFYKCTHYYYKNLYFTDFNSVYELKLNRARKV